MCLLEGKNKPFAKLLNWKYENNTNPSKSLKKQSGHDKTNMTLCVSSED